MQVISLDEAKNNIESIFDSVRLDKEEVVVYHKDRDSVVIIPLEEYNSIKETKYLLSSNNNKEALLASL